MWPMLAAAGGMAALGMIREREKAKAQRKYNEGQAEISRYSPWTGMQGQITPVFDDSLGAGLQGGLSGAMMAQNFSKANPSSQAQMEQQAVNTTEAVDGAQGGYKNSMFGQDQYQMSRPRMARSPYQFNFGG